MNGRRSSINLEVLLYVVFFLVAAWLRLMHLGVFPLSAEEANHALAAASVTPHASAYWNEGEIATPQNPAYHTFTALLFHLVGAGEASARLISALAGTLLVLTPIFARRRLGRTNALVLAALFVFSPLMVTSSRTAGGPDLAALGIVATLMLLIGADCEEAYRKRLPWMAGSVGFSLAAGADALHGLATLGLSALLVVSLKAYVGSPPNVIDGKKAYPYAWISLTVLIGVVTGFGFSLSGVAGMTESIGAWFAGWFNRGELAGVTALAMIPLYEPLVLVFGIIGIVNAVRKPDWLARCAMLWFVTGLFVNLIYPARKASDLVWVVFPLAFLAAQELVSLITRVTKRKTWLEFFGLSSILLYLVSIDFILLEMYAQHGALTFRTIVLTPIQSLVVILGLLVIAAFIVVLFALGWDAITAFEASSSTVALFLVILTISAAWRLNLTPAAASAQELWRPQSTTPSVFTLRSTIHSIMQANTGRKDGLALHVYHGADRAEIAWAVREFKPTSVNEELNADPALILLPESVDLNEYLGEYVGQSFYLVERWDWSGFLPPEPAKWWAKREAPIVRESWMLLVRVDLVRGGEQSTSPAPPDEVDELSP